MIPISKILGYEGLKVPGLGRETLQSRDTVRVPLNQKLRLPPDLFELPVAVEQQAQKELTTRAGVVNPDHYEEVGRNMLGTHDPLGHSMFSHQAFTING